MDEVKKLAADRVAKDMGMSRSDVLAIGEAQFKYLRETMMKGEFEQIRLTRIGVFWVNPRRLQFVNNKRILSSAKKIAGKFDHVFDKEKEE